MSQPDLKYPRITEAQYNNALNALQDAETALKDLRDEWTEHGAPEQANWVRRTARQDLISVAAILTTLASTTPTANPYAFDR